MCYIKGKSSYSFKKVIHKLGIVPVIKLVVICPILSKHLINLTDIYGSVEKTESTRKRNGEILKAFIES